MSLIEVSDLLLGLNKDEAEDYLGKEIIAELLGQGVLSVNPFSGLLEKTRKTEDFYP